MTDDNPRHGTDQPGTRVWAIQRETDDAVYAYGFGRYVGDRLLPGWDHPDTLTLCEQAIRRNDAERPGFDPRPFYDQRVAEGKMTREEADKVLADAQKRIAAIRARPLADRALELARSMGKNPVIALDSGGYVWGAECWWGEATPDTPQNWAKGRTIIAVPAPQRPAGEVLP